MKRIIVCIISGLLAVAVNGQAVVRFGTPSTSLGVATVPIIFDNIPTPLTTFYLNLDFNHNIYDLMSWEQSDSLTMAGGLGLANVVCQFGNIRIAWANAMHPTVLNDTIFILKFSNSSNACDDFIWDTISPGIKCGLSNINLIPATFESYLCVTTASENALLLKETVRISAYNNSVLIDSEGEGIAYLTDIMGRVLLSQPIEVGRNTIYVNKPGVYVVNVRTSASFEKSMKVIVL